MKCIRGDRPDVGMVCPICKSRVVDPVPGKEVRAHFPFCSERCKLIDLGRWLDGKYQVPVVDREDGSTPPRDPLTTD
jgi:endogenous inhibitor of DNA gyrase (YacG/DUF329 family)